MFWQNVHMDVADQRGNSDLIDMCSMYNIFSIYISINHFPSLHIELGFRAGLNHPTPVHLSICPWQLGPRGFPLP